MQTQEDIMILDAGLAFFGQCLPFWLWIQLDRLAFMMQTVSFNSLPGKKKLSEWVNSEKWKKVSLKIPETSSYICFGDVAIIHVAYAVTAIGLISQ